MKQLEVIQEHAAKVLAIVEVAVEQKSIGEEAAKELRRRLRAASVLARGIEKDFRS